VVARKNRAVLKIPVAILTDGPCRIFFFSANHFVIDKRMAQAYASVRHTAERGGTAPRPTL
jgi:hypothetical protein